MNRWTGESKTRRMQRSFAAHLRHVGRVYPAAEFRWVVLILDNAPWHRGGLIDEALRDNPHMEFYRLPSYSPCLNPIERFWKKLRRRAMHNRLFDTVADLKRSIDPEQCELLPDGSGEGQIDRAELLSGTDESDIFTGLVNEEAARPGGEAPTGPETQAEARMRAIGYKQATKPDDTTRPRVQSVDRAVTC